MPTGKYNLVEAADLTSVDFAQNFLPFLHDKELFQFERQARLEALSNRADDCRPHPLREVTIPKSSLLSRPGALPVYEDWVVFTAVVAAIARTVEKKLVPAEQQVLFSYRWEEASLESMIKGAGYGIYRARSLALLNEFPYALETDITAYFEHVDPKILRSVLLRLGADTEDVKFLNESLLRRWTHFSGRGIPQGPWASSYLGNVYLDSLDKGMLLSGFTFIRYMDDMRIFCKDITQARRAVLRLTELARELGLSVQASKTQIYTREQARVAWRGYQNWLLELHEVELQQRLQEHFASIGPYEDPDETGMPEVEIDEGPLRTLFGLVVAVPPYNVDKKGLRFALDKFLEKRSPHALEYCVAHLWEQPHLAPHTSRYIAAFAEATGVVQRIVQFLRSPECVYDWQAMHLVARLIDVPADGDLLSYALGVAQDLNRDIGLRSVCVDYVGRHGTYEQVRQLCRFFPKDRSEEVRAAIILNSQRLQATERRYFLGACRGLSSNLDAAVAVAWV